MTKKETYSSALKEILNFTEIKYAVLSQAIGYDLSYISKWTTGMRLPAAKNIDRINQEISRFLSNVIIKRNKSIEFAEHFLNTDTIEQENITFEIYNYLSTAYRNSLNCKKDKGKIVVSKEEKIILGKLECVTFLKNIIKEKIENNTMPPPASLSPENFGI